MATFTPGKRRNKPWRARAWVGAERWFLGYYATKEEAEQVEARFKGAEV